LQQAFVNDGKLERAGKELGLVDVMIPRDWLPASAYQRRKNTVRTLPENKTRGGAIALIHFLTKHAGGANTVVYACNRGNGLSDTIVDTFFPNLRFVVYGEASEDVSASDRVETHAARFTDADAEVYKGQEGVLFICVYPSLKDDKASANNLWPDMKNQRRWVQMIRPAAAMLQWRLPFTPPAGESECVCFLAPPLGVLRRTPGSPPVPSFAFRSAWRRYFDGEVFLLPWNRTSLNTCVLIVTNVDAVRTYDHSDYEGYQRPSPAVAVAVASPCSFTPMCADTCPSPTL
jgi:hypothetical protein